MSEEVKEKKKTTKTAKLFGFLLIPSIVTSTFLILWLIYETILSASYSENQKDHDAIIITVLILSFLMAIGFGVKLARRWDNFKRGKKKLLGFLVFMPAFIVAFIWIDYELGRAKRDDYNYKSYTEFYEKSVGVGDVIVYLAGSEESIRGSIIGESKKFITMKARRDKFLIPKDKILFIEED